VERLRDEVGAAVVGNEVVEDAEQLDDVAVTVDDWISELLANAFRPCGHLAPLRVIRNRDTSIEIFVSYL
jgi:hypothetical protein